MELFEETSDTASHPYIRRLGEGAYAAERTTIGQADLLAQAGLPVPKGMVITRGAHRAFLLSSGLLGQLLGYTDEETHEQILNAQLWHTRIKHSPSLVEGELNRAICEALMELGAPSVAVISEEVRIGDLKSIPEVKCAILEVWLSEGGFERQISAARSTEEIPMWPVLIQREINALYTGWSTLETVPVESPRVGAHFGGRKVALYDVEPADGEGNESEGITRLTLDAASVLGARPRILWGLEGGRWYILSTEMEENEKSLQG